MVEHNSLDVKRLIDQLEHDPDVYVRIRAASALAGCKDTRAIFTLIKALKAESSMTAGATADGVPVELHLYGAGDIQSTAASSLLQLVSELGKERQIDPHLEKAIDPLLIALQDEDMYVRRAAFVVLCELSALLQNDVAVEALICVQPGIDAHMLGHSVVTIEGRRHTALDKLLMLLNKLATKGEPEPFLCALSSSEDKVAVYAATTLLEMGQAQIVVDIIKKTRVSANVFDAIFTHLKEIDSETAMTYLTQMLQDGIPWIRVCAARQLRNYSDNRAIEALSKWQNFLQNVLPKCYRCGKSASNKLKDGIFWCSWCGDSFTLEDAYGAQ